MLRVCQVTGRGQMSGNNVSHAKNRTKRRFMVNLHTKKFKLDDGRINKLRVSQRGLRTIDKKGIDKVVEDMRARGEKV